MEVNAESAFAWSRECQITSHKKTRCVKTRCLRYLPEFLSQGWSHSGLDSSGHPTRRHQPYRTWAGDDLFWPGKLVSFMDPWGNLPKNLILVHPRHRIFLQIVASTNPMNAWLSMKQGSILHRWGWCQGKCGAKIRWLVKQWRPPWISMRILINHDNPHSRETF